MNGLASFQLDQVRLANVLQRTYGLCFTNKWAKVTLLVGDSIVLGLAVADDHKMDAISGQHSTSYYQMTAMPEGTLYGKQAVRDWSDLVQVGDYVLLDAVLNDTGTKGDLAWRVRRIHDIKSPSLAWKELLMSQLFGGPGQKGQRREACSCTQLVGRLVKEKKPLFMAWCQCHKSCVADLFKTIMSTVEVAREDVERKSDLTFSDLVDIVQKYYTFVADFSGDLIKL